MCAACQTGHQEIRNLFNHANMRAEIFNTTNNFLWCTHALPRPFSSPCTFSYAFVVPPSPPLGGYVLFERPPMLNISVSNDLTQMVNFPIWIPDPDCDLLFWIYLFVLNPVFILLLLALHWEFLIMLLSQFP